MRSSIWLCFSLAALGCDGFVLAPPHAGPPVTSVTPRPPADPLPSQAECAQQTPDPGWVGLHRLTYLEYDHTLRDLLGSTGHPSDQLPPASVPAYDNAAADLAHLPVETVEKLVDLSEQVVDDAFAAHAAQLITCDPAVVGAAACARTVLTRLGEKAYRRPLEQAELDALVALAQSTTPFVDGIKLAVRGLVSSPSFLYRHVQLQLPDEPSVVQALSPYELATRLSYFLWATLPDDELFAHARAGDLPQPDVLRVQVARMLADPKASAFLSELYAYWYSLDALDTHDVDPALFPELTAELRADMKGETKAFFADAVTHGVNPLGLLTADYSFVNERLAQHYGISGVTGTAFQRVALAGAHRRGLVTQASVLTLTSSPNMTSIVHRGLWVLDRVLCTVPPPPPPNVPSETVPAGFTGTRRELDEQHRASPACSSCHSMIDPIGFGLEDYDAIGRYRTMDNGEPIDSTGTLPDGRSFNGALELVALLQSDPGAHACLAEHFVRQALGRKSVSADACTLRHIVDDGVGTDRSLTDLVFAVVTSEAFLNERGGQP